MSKRKRVVRIVGKPVEGERSRRSILEELGLSKAEVQQRDLNLAFKLKG